MMLPKFRGLRCSERLSISKLCWGDNFEEVGHT